MLADGHAGAAVIGPEAFFRIHARERGRHAGLFERLEQWADGQDGALRLPKRVAAVEMVEAIERADFGEAGHLVFAEFGDAAGEIVDAGEGAGTDDGAAGLLA